MARGAEAERVVLAAGMARRRRPARLERGLAALTTGLSPPLTGVEAVVGGVGGVEAGRAVTAAHAGSPIGLRVTVAEHAGEDVLRTVRRRPALARRLLPQHHLRQVRPVVEAAAGNDR